MGPAPGSFRLPAYTAGSLTGSGWPGCELRLTHGPKEYSKAMARKHPTRPRSGTTASRDGKARPAGRASDRRGAVSSAARPGSGRSGGRAGSPVSGKSVARPKGVPAVTPGVRPGVAAGRPRPAGRAAQAPVAPPRPRPEAAAPPVQHGVRVESVDAERAGQRLDNFLATRMKGVPKAAVYRMLRTGQVRVNGKRAQPDTRLEAGDEVRIPPFQALAPGAVAPPSESLRDTLAARVLREDGELLVLDKPSGLAAHGGSGVSLGAIEAMRALRPHLEIELVHRLDRDTSGLMLMAKKHSALRRLQALIREGRVEKHYLALVMGTPARERFEVNAALAKNQLRGGERMVEVDEEEGKPSLSRFRVIERYPGAALVDVQILTGRTHQIRVHAAHAGHPLAGDAKYGDEAFNKRMRAAGLKRLFLHAHSLRFPWGGEGEEMLLSAPLAPELRAVLEQLGKSA